MAMFVIIKPRGNVKLGDTFKELEIVEMKNIGDYNVFIQNRVGVKPIYKQVGDYILWYSDPNEYIFTELNESFEVPTEVTQIPNLLVNEDEIAFGDVVITSNVITNNADLFYGLDDEDYAGIINSFVDAGQVLVEHGDDEETFVIDRVFDGLLSPSKKVHEELEEPVIEEIEIIDDKEMLQMDLIEYEDEDYVPDDELYDKPFGGTDEDFDTIDSETLEEQEQEYLRSL
ncbi:hypothetical protein [Staphylococcus xylosus]|uniref:hypothetical protein n=1 Tax=Staphylococcus xylosus TaxID=1288 RepID=UPI000D1D3395|nr:hypothetical protein [Staphylococcus xylosus]PTH96995.1 hypothetical protein BU099_12310 [Staphylococcus xylosus]